MIRPNIELIDKVIEAATCAFCESLGSEKVLVSRRDLATMISCMRVAKTDIKDSLLSEIRKVG